MTNPIPADVQAALEDLAAELAGHSLVAAPALADRLSGHLDRLSLAWVAQDQFALSDLATLLREQVNQAKATGLSMDQIFLLQLWHDTVQGRLPERVDAGLVAELGALLTDPAWPTPMGAEEARMLADMLARILPPPPSPAVTTPAPAAPSSLRPETVNIDLDVSRPLQIEPGSPSAPVAYPMPSREPRPETIIMELDLDPPPAASSPPVVPISFQTPQPDSIVPNLDPPPSLESGARSLPATSVTPVAQGPATVEEQLAAQPGGDTGAGNEEPLSLTGEVIEILQKELQDMARLAGDWVASLAHQRGQDTAPNDLRRQIALQLERFAAAVGVFGMKGLEQLALRVHPCLNASSDTDPVAVRKLAEIVSEWPVHAGSYLGHLGQPDAAVDLLTCMQDARWREPLPHDAVAPTRALLEEVRVQTEEGVTQSMPRVAMPEDVSLALPDDIAPALLDALLQELPGQCERLSAAIQSLLAGGPLDDLRAAQRIAHTIKGAANTVGVRGLANLTHRLEDLLIAYVGREQRPADGVADVLIKATDCLLQMSDCLLGRDCAPADARDILQDILELNYQIHVSGELPRAAPVPAEAIAAAPTVAASAPLAPATGPAPAAPPVAAEEERRTEDNLRVPAALVDNLFRLTGESMIATTRLREYLQRTAQSLKQLQDRNELLALIAAELEEFIHIRHARASAISLAQGEDDFDPLEMERLNELHALSSRLQENVVDTRELRTHIHKQGSEADEALVAQERLQGQQREIVSRFRMLPVSDIASRLQRGVRQACRMTGKAVDLVINGLDTLMDSHLLNLLVDPLMHVLRNAVDHGIEPAEVRRTRGKPVKGRITLTFFHDSNDVIVRCQDDGGGLDLDAIRTTAIAEGIFAADHTPTEEEMKALIAQPGFSTRASTTQTSGRGIGMSAVAEQIAELKGAVHIDSQRHQGCTVEFRVPTSLLSVSCVLARCGGRVVGVANRHVEKIIPLHRTHITHSAAGGACYEWEQKRYLVSELAPLLDLPAAMGTGSGLLLTDGARQPRLLGVDEIIGMRSVVLKSLGAYLRPFNGLLGVTILGDGGVAPVVNPVELINRPPQAAAQGAVRPAALRQPTRKRVLIIDDSISVRRTLGQLLGDAGYQTAAAGDGLEALSVIAAQVPDVILVDLEMPRMNGLEFTAHVRGQEEIKQLPIIMLTSRSTDKHRQQAMNTGVDVYLVKPYQDDVLLEHVEQLLNGPPSRARRGATSG